MRSGRVFVLVCFLTLACVIFFSINRARKGKLPYLRKLPGVDAIREAVGRSTELGKPIVYSPGIAGLSGETGAQTFASLEILSYVAKTAAEYDTRLIVCIRIPEVLPIAEEVVRTGYLSAGKIESYDANDVRFLSSAQFAYAAGVMGIMERERPGATFLLGGFWAESLMFAEVGNTIGALQIAGTANLHQIQFFVAACDYTIIGEELFAVGAYFSEDPIKRGAISGQDIGKLIAVGLIIAGVILTTFGGAETVDKIVHW